MYITFRHFTGRKITSVYIHNPNLRYYKAPWWIRVDDGD